MPDDNFNRYCEDLLVRYNRRNTRALTRHLESLCSFLREEGNHVVQIMFGGSVQKGTYVTGLSDVDLLLIVNESSPTGTGRCSNWRLIIAVTPRSRTPFETSSTAWG